MSSTSISAAERCLAAIELRETDRPPIDLHNFQPAALALGGSMKDVLQSGELLAEAMIIAHREFGHDMILMENGTACNAQACGMEIVYRDDSAPAVHGRLVEDYADLDRLEVPDPETTFPMNEILKAVRIARKELGDTAWICGRADQGPMDLAAQLRGISELMMDIATGELDKEIDALLDYSRRVATRYAFALMDAGAHSTSIGEPVAGPEMMSPAHYKRIAWPHEKKMVHELQAKGIIIHNHICGNTIPIIDDFIATGAQVLEIDHKTDMTIAKEHGAGKTCFLGNIDTSLLASGTPEEVAAATKEAIAVLGAGGGLIIGPGCAMSAETPAENTHALVETAKRIS